MCLSGACFSELDLERVAAATRGFTGADLRRLVEDAKNQVAYLLLTKGAVPDVTEEFLKLVKSLQKGKNRYRYGSSKERFGFRADGDETA